MKKQSNLYIFMYASVMVIIVAAVLSFSAMSLKPRQQKNIEIEKMKNILSSIRIDATEKDAQEKYDKYIIESIVMDPMGNTLENEDAFSVEMEKEVFKLRQISEMEASIRASVESPFSAFLHQKFGEKEKDANEIEKRIEEVKKERKLPVYIGQLDDNSKKIVIPLRGKGLWGPLWGYISLNGDYKTVYGAVFDHKGETPGLGAEIANAEFQKPFEGKMIFNEQGEFVSIEVVKGGADPNNSYQVDAISGGTITSKGLEAMLFDCLKDYQVYFNNQRN